MSEPSSALVHEVFSSGPSDRLLKCGAPEQHLGSQDSLASKGSNHELKCDLDTMDGVKDVVADVEEKQSLASPDIVGIEDEVMELEGRPAGSREGVGKKLSHPVGERIEMRRKVGKDTGAGPRSSQAPSVTPRAKAKNDQEGILLMQSSWGSREPLENKAEDQTHARVFMKNRDLWEKRSGSSPSSDEEKTPVAFNEFWDKPVRQKQTPDLDLPPPSSLAATRPPVPVPRPSIRHQSQDSRSSSSPGHSPPIRTGADNFAAQAGDTLKKSTPTPVPKPRTEPLVVQDMPRSQVVPIRSPGPRTAKLLSKFQQSGPVATPQSPFQALCGEQCNHNLIPVQSLTDNYEEMGAPKSQVYKLLGNMRATESQVILDRLGLSCLGNINSSNMQICPIRKMELLNFRSRSNHKPNCELCKGTRHLKKVTILRSAFFKDSGVKIFAEQMSCEACNAKYKTEYQDWIKAYTEKLKKSNEEGFNSTIGAAGDSSKKAEVTSAASLLPPMATHVAASDKENRSPIMPGESGTSVEKKISNGRQKVSLKNAFQDTKNKKHAIEETGPSESNSTVKRLRQEPTIDDNECVEGKFDMDSEQQFDQICETVPRKGRGDPTGVERSPPVQRETSCESVIKQSQSSEESIQSSQSIEEKNADLDEDYVDTETSDKEKFKLLQEFFRVISNGKIVIEYRWSSENISDRVERDRSNKLNSMVKELLQTIFPGGSESYHEKIINKAFRKDKSESKSIMLLNKLIEAYTNTESREVKKFLVMELSLLKKFDELRQLLPGFTLYQYKQAKKNLKEYGLTKLPTPGYLNVTRNRRDIDSTVHYVQFHLTFVRDVSYGATEIELSTGEKITVQNAVQEVLTEVIIRMYERHYQEEKESYENLTTLPYPIKLFGKTTLRKLAKTIPLGALNSLRGLDYYAAAGSEACDSVRKDLKEKVLPRASSPQDITAIQNLEISMQQAHRHLKSEFKEEISTSSPVAAHCSVWALSDPTVPDFSSICDHQHDSHCSECDMRSTSLKEYKHLVEKLFASDNFEDRETRFEMLENISCIEEWVKHEVRGYHQNLKEKEILGSLENRRSGHLTMDLAMKWLPRKFREPMDAWFAQRGLGWQVVLLWYRDEPNTDVQIQAFVQIFGAEKQDCYANYSCLDYTIAEVKSSRPELEVLSMSSDNAGNYHNNLAMTSFIPAIAEKYNLSHVSYDFKEPQKGKGPVDARIASMKKNMLVFLNSGNDVATPIQMKEAIEAFTGVKGTKVCVLEVNRSLEANWKAKKTIGGISKMYSFTYERSQTGDWYLRYRQHSDIGRGKLIKLGNVVPISLNPTIISPYVSSVSSSDTSVKSKPERRLKGVSKAFPCSELDCVLAFESKEKLDIHISTGNHTTVADIKNKEDQSKLLYIEHINKGGVATLNYLKQLEEVGVPTTKLDQGWGLKTREKGGPLPEPAKKVLMELYETGKETKRKITPEEGSKILRRKFPNEEIMWLKPSQVKSQFAVMTRVDKNLGGFDEDDTIAREERRLLQQAGETIAEEHLME